MIDLNGSGVARGDARYGSKCNAAPVGAMTLLVESDFDGRMSIPVADVHDASRKYREYVEREDLGSSQVSFGQVVVGGKRVAEIYYNGRIVLENRG